LIKWVVEFKSLAAKIVVASLSAKITVASLSAAVAFGKFLKAQFLNETVGISDSNQKATAKTLQDTFLAQEQTSFSTAKPFADSAGINDSQIIGAGKVALDNLGFVDNIQHFGYHKAVSDQAALQDVFARSVVYQRSITDVFSVTDDIDGSATANDDQELSFIKVTSNSFSLLDNEFFNLAKIISESFSVGDSGQLIMQNYAEATYFAADYVGAAQSF